MPITILNYTKNTSIHPAKARAFLLIEAPAFFINHKTMDDVTPAHNIFLHPNIPDKGIPYSTMLGAFVVVGIPNLTIGPVSAVLITEEHYVPHSLVVLPYPMYSGSGCDFKIVC